MMSIAISFFVIFSAAWFPDKPVGKPAGAEELLRFVPDDATFVVTADTTSLGTSILRGMDELARERFVLTWPALYDSYRRVMQQRDTAMAALVASTGLRLPDDLRYLTFAVVAGDEGDAEPLLVLGGHLTARLADVLAQQAHATQTRMIGAAQLREPASDTPGSRRDMSVAWLADNGVALFGNLHLVERVVRADQEKRRKPSALLTRLRALCDRDTYLAAAFQPTPTLLAMMHREGDLGPLQPLAAGLQSAIVTFGYKEFLVELRAAERKALPRYQALLEGWSYWMRGSQFALDGVLRFAEALMDSADPGLSAELREAFRHRDEMVAYVRRVLGTGPSNPQVNVNTREGMVALRANGSPLLTLAPLLLVVGTGAAWHW